MTCWRDRATFTAALLALVVGPSGCQAASRPSLAGLTPDYASLMSLPGCQSPSQARGQKPTPLPSFLELGADAPGNKESRTARIRAVVNGDPILDEEVQAAALQHLIGVSDESQRARILNEKLNEIIDRELLLQDAIARLGKRADRFLEDLTRIAEKEFERQWLYRLMHANKQTDPELFKAMIRAQGLPYEQIRRQWIRNFIAMEYLRSRIEPSITRIGHLQTVEYYEQHPEEFRVEDSVVWQDLFISAANHPTPQAARQFAESLAERARKGEDFVKLAKQFDNGDSSLRENCTGIGTKRGEIQPPEAEPVLFRLKPGEVGPVIEIGSGYHVIRLVERTYAGQRPFDDKVQKAIREKLRGKVFQLEMKRILNDLKQRAIIEVASDSK
jgi:hypothetical protein